MLTPMTLTDDAAARAADALQAAYFRRSLHGERAQLCTEIAKRHEYIDRRAKSSTTHPVQRLRSQLRSAEAQLRHLDQLIARLDHGFGRPSEPN